MAAISNPITAQSRHGLISRSVESVRLTWVRFSSFFASVWANAIGTVRRPLTEGWLVRFWLSACFCVLGTASPAICHSFDGPLIVSSTESAGPNDAIAIQGSGFGRTPQVWLSEVQGNETTLKPTIRLRILTNSDSLVAARLPSSISRGLYAVWIFNGIAQGGPVWINQPRETSREFSQISPSGSFRLWGQNLVVPRSRPWVRFVNTRDSSMLPGQVTGGDPYQLAVISPSNLTIGATYSLIISNGYGGNWGQSKVSDLITVRQPGADPLHLAVPWVSDLFGAFSNTYNVKTDRRLPVHAVGDGIADDCIPIQLAIDAAFKDG